MPMNMSPFVGSFGMQGQMTMAIPNQMGGIYGIMGPQPNQFEPEQPLLKTMLQQPPQRRRTLNDIETSDRYGKKFKKDTSKGFMQLLNSGNIDGSFTGSFLYFSTIH